MNLSILFKPENSKQMKDSNYQFDFGAKFQFSLWNEPINSNGYLIRAKIQSYAWKISKSNSDFLGEKRLST